MIQLVLAAIFVGVFFFFDDLGTDEEKRKCSVASNTQVIEKCGFDPNYRGED